MYYLIPIIALVCGLRAGAQNTVTATVTNFSSNKGVCRACLYNNADAFNGNGAAVQCVAVGIQNKSALLSFTGIPRGTYAISVFHDANNNNEFDTNFLGIPKEGYGASKNNLPFAAAPRFSSNKFEVTDGAPATVNIKLRYL